VPPHLHRRRDVGCIPPQPAVERDTEGDLTVGVQSSDCEFDSWPGSAFCASPYLHRRRNVGRVTPQAAVERDTEGGPHNLVQDVAVAPKDGIL